MKIMAIELTDLDEYFCKKYANYDKLCLLPGYQMPKMQDSKIGEDGLTYTYTLPVETMSLANQKNKAEVLQALKQRLFDQTFSFSFSVQSWWQRFTNLFRKHTSKKVIRGILEKHGISIAEAGAGLEIPEEVWKGICKGTFLPTKNTVLSFALTAHLTAEDADALFEVCGYEWDYTLVKDTVLSYLLQNRVYNEEIIRKALEEYNVENLFIRYTDEKNA